MTYTAARVVAALFLALTGWVASRAVMAQMDELQNFGLFEYVNTALGAAVGWVVIGSRTGRGMSNAVGVGITAAVVLTFWGLFVQSAREMVIMANRRLYDGPLEALIGMFGIGIDFFLQTMTPSVVAALLFGGVLSAVFAESASRRWL
ncbi:hypothetical protein SAMN05216196_108120 [Lutimaribacter pacificus]|uniref:Tellurium resistance protein n=1 Tax=Lutimaribacter pacificus TaxID=391948 RepID=A0A1H0LSH8_9RHOB|nr:TrgA family protein [Lutimaribacter pacificus]SDO71182.1 hypothetical protein SAMN05216196_108120 [Lutimaribacter pacificus]SHK03786.1 hypothetical protein SAMN05444142_10337 [Lutimaribacter pacificus]